MPLGSTVQRLRTLSWLSPASFAVFLISMLFLSIVPVGRYHFAFAIVEWTEMLLGTFIAALVFVVTISGPRQHGDNSGRKRWILAILGLSLWAIFWLSAVVIHRGTSQTSGVAIRRQIGAFPISGGPGLEALYSDKTTQWAGYLSAGLLFNVGSASPGTSFSGTAGLIYNVPKASSYAGPFVSLSVPVPLLPKNVLPDILKGLILGYGALSQTKGSGPAYLAFIAAATAMSATLAIDPNRLTANVFWGPPNLFGITLSLGKPSDNGRVQFGVTADILLTKDVPFE